MIDLSVEREFEESLGIKSGTMMIRRTIKALGWDLRACEHHCLGRGKVFTGLSKKQEWTLERKKVVHVIEIHGISTEW